jgi:hypothetical protein
LHLELPVLRSEDFDLSVGSAQLDFFIPDSEDLIFEVTFSLDEFTLGLGVFTLLLLVPLNPHVPGVLLSLNDLIQVAHLFIELLLSQLKLLFNALAFYHFTIQLSVFVYNLLVLLINFLKLTGHCFFLCC